MEKEFNIEKFGEFMNDIASFSKRIEIEVKKYEKYFRKNNWSKRHRLKYIFNTIIKDKYYIEKNTYLTFFNIATLSIMSGDYDGDNINI